MTTKIFSETHILKYCEIKYKEESKKHVLSFFNAPPSLSIVLKCTLHSSQKQGIERLNYMLSHIQDEEILALYQRLQVHEINYLFFSSENEENERSGFGMFNIAKNENLLFGGLGGNLLTIDSVFKSNKLQKGVFKIVNDACLLNDLGTHLFKNLRDGYWYLDY